MEAGGIGFRLLKLGLSCAVCHHVEPVAVSAVLGHATLVGGEQNRSCGRRQALHFDQTQLAGFQIQAGYVVPQVLLVHVGDLPALSSLVLHDHLHGGHLGLGVGPQAAYILGLAFRVGQN